MGRDDSADGSNLPAPYRNPWSALGEDLRAAAADLRLRSRELWRRNRQGALWHPSWWPPDLTPLFWPLLLASFLAALLAFGLGVFQLLRLLPAAAPAPAEPAVAGATEPMEPLSVGSGTGATPAPTPPESLNERTSPPEVRSDLDTPATAAAGALGEGQASPAKAPPDPLVALLNAPEAAGWLTAAQGRADQGLLVLQLAPAYRRLAPVEQQRRALLWQAMAAELGYEHLELRDPRAGLLGRDALVGEGMILFTPPPA